MKLKNRIALVTGAGDGIGRGIATALAAEGADVALCDINSVTVAETARRAESAGRRCYFETIDIRDPAAIARFVASTIKQLGGVDILINNAAVMPVAPCEELTAELVDSVLAVNLRAPILFTRHVIPAMRARGGGSIIHMSSVTGHNGHAGVTVYGASKGALMALARGQAIELARYNIRVNTISPGTIDSPMLHRFLQENATEPQRARKAFDRTHPRGIVGSIDEVAKVFVFLASDDAANITATDIRVDGGYCVQGTQPRD
jgi:NAD(P)-dependent dehydrogenase (short-subunit alcohol dehydrogenase family)